MVDITTVSHDTKTPENYSKYLDRIDSYLEICKGKTVLEIGPCHWMMSERILSKNPISLDTIEPDPYAHNRKPTGLTNHLMTANDFFAKDKRTFDVVICVGVLYHLHSPLHMLELILNIAKPKHFVLETTNNIATKPSIYKEEMSVPGNAFGDKGINKPVGYNVTIPNDYYENIVLDFNYKLCNKEYIEETFRSKCDVFIWRFEK